MSTKNVVGIYWKNTKKARIYYGIQTNEKTQLIPNEELTSQEVYMIEMLASQQIANQILFCEQNSLFIKNKEEFVPDEYFFEEEAQEQQQSQQQSQQQQQQQSQQQLQQQSPQISYHDTPVLKTKTLKQKFQIIKVYRKNDKIVQEHPKHPVYEFQKQGEMDCNRIIRIIQWQKGIIKMKTQIFLQIQNEQFVKLNELKVLNASLVLEYILMNCVLIK